MPVLIPAAIAAAAAGTKAAIDKQQSDQQQANKQQQGPPPKDNAWYQDQAQKDQGRLEGEAAKYRNPLLSGVRYDPTMKARMEEGYQQSQQSRGDAQDALGLSRQAAEGKVPSVANLQMNEGLNKTLSSQVAAAGSARGGPQAGAAAARGAALGSVQAQDDIVGKQSIMRADEMAKGREEYQRGAGQLRAQDLASRGLSGEEAFKGAGLDLQSRLGMGQLGLGYEGLSRGAFGQGMGAGQFDQKMGMEQQNSDRQLGMGVANSIMNFLGSIAGAAGMASDARTKKEVSTLSGGDYDIEESKGGGYHLVHSSGASVGPESGGTAFKTKEDAIGRLGGMGYKMPASAPQQAGQAQAASKGGGQGGGAQPAVSAPRAAPPPAPPSVTEDEHRKRMSDVANRYETSALVQNSPPGQVGTPGVAVPLEQQANPNIKLSPASLNFLVGLGDEAGNPAAPSTQPAMSQLVGKNWDAPKTKELADPYAGGAKPGDLGGKASPDALPKGDAKGADAKGGDQAAAAQKLKQAFKVEVPEFGHMDLSPTVDLNGNMVSDEKKKVDIGSIEARKSEGEGPRKAQVRQNPEHEHRPSAIDTTKGYDSQGHKIPVVGAMHVERLLKPEKSNTATFSETDVQALKENPLAVMTPYELGHAFGPQAAQKLLPIIGSAQNVMSGQTPLPTLEQVGDAATKPITQPLTATGKGRLRRDIQVAGAKYEDEESRRASRSQGIPYVSDKKKKTGESPAATSADALLSALADGAATYRYKDKALEPSSEPNGGKYMGVMAQSLEKVPEIGKQLVHAAPDGTKMVEPMALLSALAAAVGRLEQKKRK
jgi:hypothetical protein